MANNLKTLSLDELIFIAKCLQELIKGPHEFSTWSEIQTLGKEELTTAVLMIEKTIISKSFFEPSIADREMESLNAKFTSLIDAVTQLPPDLEIALNSSARNEFSNKYMVPDIKAILQSLKTWRNATVGVIDNIHEKAPAAKLGPKNWKTQYIAHYASDYYFSSKRKIPITNNGNSNVRLKRIVGKICNHFKRDQMGGVRGRCDETVQNLVLGKRNLASPIL